MKTRLSGIIRWLVLAVFVLAAGVCYSCGPGGQTAGLSRAETPGAEFTGKTAENDEAAGGTSGEAAGGGEAAVRSGEAVAGDVKDAPVNGGNAAEQEESRPRQTCFVHVCGEVMQPGVYELEEGQRIFEAVEQAGGFTADAAESYLNLAEPVRDGMKVQVPDKAQAESLAGGAGAVAGGNTPDSFPGSVGVSGSAGPGNGAGNAATAKININTAAKAELMTLKGIGEARAEDIISFRIKRGGFDRIEDIMEVSGIKDAAFQKIKDDITV